MRTTTLLIFFMGLIFFIGNLKYKISQGPHDEGRSSIAPWGDPRPPYRNDMLQEQSEDEEINEDEVRELEFLQEMEDENLENENNKEETTES